MAGLGYDIWTIKADLDRGQDAVRSLDLETIDGEGGVDRVAADVARAFASAHDRADGSPFLAVLAPIPVIGDQVQAMRDLTEHADTLGGFAAKAGERVQVLLDESRSDSRARVTLMRVAQEELADIEDALVPILLDPGAEGWLLGPLTGAREKFVSLLLTARRDVVNGQKFAAALERFLAGPGDHLVLGANNAEHWGGRGMLLSAGTVSVFNGDFEPSRFENTVPMNLRFFGKPEGIEVPGHLLDLYSPFRVDRDFVSAGSSPHFPQVGPIVAELAANGPLGEVGSVFAVDAIALQKLMQVTGPVTVQGEEIGADEVIDKVLNESYRTFDTLDSRFERYEQQGDIAEAVLGAFKEGDVSILALGSALIDAAKGRHVMAWSPDPDLQQLWTQVGVAGALRPDGLLISVNNMSANKLDYFIAPTAEMQVEPAADGSQQVTLSVTVPNETRDPDLTSEYIEGFGTCCVGPGDHRVMLDLHLPQSAYQAVSGEFPFTGHGADGPNQAIVTVFNVKNGEAVTSSVTFRLPASQRSLTLHADGRLRNLELTFRGTSYVADQDRLITW